MDISINFGKKSILKILVVFNDIKVLNISIAAFMKIFIQLKRLHKYYNLNSLFLEIIIIISNYLLLIIYIKLS